MPSLFEIENKYQHLLQSLEENEGELTPGLEEELIINEEDFESKAASYRAMILKWRGEIEAGKKEKARVEAFIKNRTTAIEKLSSNLDQALVNRNLSELDMKEKGKISYRKSTSVQVDEDLLPKKWFNKVVKMTPDKVKIKEQLNLGVNIKGAELVTKQNIQIK